MFNIRWHDEGHIRTVIVDGDLDLASDQEFKAALDADELIVDLSGVTFIDSVSLGALIRAHGRTSALTLIQSHEVEQFLSIRGLNHFFDGS